MGIIKPFDRRTFLAGSLATAGAAVLGTAPRAAFGAEETPKPGGTIIYAMEAEPDILDPHACGGWHTSRLVLQMYDQLVEHDLTVPWNKGAPPKLVPSLATAWEISPDGLQYTFTLREGVKFHDGTPFNAEAAKYNFERLWDENAPHFYPRAKAYRAPDVFFIQRLEVLDTYKFRITLKEPFNSFLLRLANLGPGMVSMISPTALKKYGNEQIALHPTGTGPFRFVERVPGDRVVMERNPDYWGGNPKVGPFLDRIVVKPVPDAATRVAGLRSGEFDMIIVPVPDSRQQLQSEGFVWDQGTVHHNWYWAFNMKDPMFKDKRVRQALNYAIDRKALCKDVLNDTAFPMEHGIIPPGMLPYDPSFTAYEYNPEKAKALLAEAGHAKGFTTTFVTSTDGSGQLLPVPIAERVQADLRQVGVNMRLNASEWVSYFTKWISGGFKDVGAAQMSFGAPDPFWLELTIGSDFFVGAAGGLNTGYYSNPAVDEVMKAARHAPPPAAGDPYAAWGLSSKAVELWSKANRMATEDAPLLLVLSDLNPFAYHKKVKGKVQTALEWFTFRTIWLDKA
jgi:peptide/nickel transport system substrate-binding protein